MLGKGCDFLSFTSDKTIQEDGSWVSIDCIKAVLKNDNGGKDTIYLALDKKPSELIEEDFKNIFYVLNARTYEVKEELENEKRD